jgi:hypothetical protein
MNRNRTTDAVDEFFLSSEKIPKNTLILHINWRDNPFFQDNQFNAEEREADYAIRPERYAHIWEGEPDMSVEGLPVLPYSSLLKCVGAAEKLGVEKSGFRYSGLDIADSMEKDADENAYAIRQGNYLEDVRTWKAKFQHITAKRADTLNKSNGVISCTYDACGMGVGLKSEFSKIPDAMTGQLPADVKRFVPFISNGKAIGGDRLFMLSGSVRIYNKDYFRDAGAQAWWNLKLRMENTLKALDGLPYNSDYCLFINPKISDLQKLLSELSQCVYETENKITINKKPKGTRSPNMADAVVFCFSNDIKRGLKI